MIRQTNNTNHLTNCSSPTPVQGMALVAEGGGQRGIFTAGILDSWLANNYNPFELLIGTSAGAQNLSSYMTNQMGYAKKSILELSKHPTFFNMKRTLLGKSAMNLDWYFDQVTNSYQLNIECALSKMKTRKLLFSATRTDDLAVEFFEPKRENWLTTLKASSALPYLYKNGVQIGNANYVDGGVASPVPIKEAYSLGARNIVTIRTVPKTQSVKSPWAHKLKSWVCNDQGRCPKVLNIITEHENAYDNALSFINSPPSDVNIIELSPPRPLLSKIMGSSEASLNADYEMGVQVGLKFLESNELH